MNRSVLLMSSGSVFAVISILFLHKFVELIDLDLEFMLESLEDWSEFTPYLVVGIFVGLPGFYMFYKGLSGLNRENL